jgi:hypothetical protein
MRIVPVNLANRPATRSSATKRIDPITSLERTPTPTTEATVRKRHVHPVHLTNSESARVFFTAAIEKALAMTRETADTHVVAVDRHSESGRETGGLNGIQVMTMTRKSIETELMIKLPDGGPDRVEILDDRRIVINDAAGNLVTTNFSIEA